MLWRDSYYCNEYDGICVATHTCIIITVSHAVINYYILFCYYYSSPVEYFINNYSLLSSKTIDASQLMRVWMHFVRILGKVHISHVLYDGHTHMMHVITYI